MAVIGACNEQYVKGFLFIYQGDKNKNGLRG